MTAKRRTVRTPAPDAARAAGAMPVEPELKEAVALLDDPATDERHDDGAADEPPPPDRS